MSIITDIISDKEIKLDMGEDWIVIESSSKHYLLDIFIRMRLDKLIHALQHLTKQQRF